MALFQFKVKFFASCNTTSHHNLPPFVSRLNELHTFFNEIDSNKDGKLSREEARRAFRTMALREEEIDTLIEVHDANGDGYLQYEEFVKLWHFKDDQGFEHLK